MNLPNDLPSRMHLARVLYGLNGKQMSAVMGFGVNQWRLYELGKSIPNGPNSRLVMIALDPYRFVKFLAMIPPRVLGVKVYVRTMKNAMDACKEIDIKLEQHREEYVKELFTRKEL